MALKIKSNDDRVRGALTAILLIGRDQIARGETTELVATALARYREDPAGYKINKAAWPEPRDLRPLTRPAQVALYQGLLAAVDRVSARIAKSKIQFNSLRELDNWLVAALKDGR